MTTKKVPPETRLVPTARQVRRVFTEYDALVMRREGYEIPEIAATIGCSISTAAKMVRCGYDRLAWVDNEVMREALRDEQNARLNLVLTKVVPLLNNMDPDIIIKAGNCVRGVEDRRAKLWGLDMERPQGQRGDEDDGHDVLDAEPHVSQEPDA